LILICLILLESNFRFKVRDKKFTAGEQHVTSGHAAELRTIGSKVMGT